LPTSADGDCHTLAQALARTLPLRDYFLVAANYSAARSQLVQRFGELMRKIWNPRNFKGQVPPGSASAALCLLMVPVASHLWWSRRTADSH
jgi:U4/U6.U5 tri-snRNP-associated protein 2